MLISVRMPRINEQWICATNLHRQILARVVRVSVGRKPLNPGFRTASMTVAVSDPLSFTPTTQESTV